MMTRINLVGGLFYLLFGLTGVAASECPVEISPPSLVVRYGESALATCHALVPIEGMGWESTVGPVNMEEGVERLNWTVEELREWTVGPLCFINPKDGDQCFEKLPVLVYQMPESVTLTVSGAESKYTERSYNLFCKVENFAPAENVTVRWFKGDTLVKQSSEKQDDPAKVGLRNRTFEMTTSFQPSDDGVEFHCEVGLDLTPDPVMKSQAVRITVHYAPKHEWTEEPLLLDADTVLDCTANGNPDPVYEWTSTSVTEKLDGRPVHKVTTAGNYTCTASNGLGSSVKHFTVLSKSAGTFWIIIGVGVAVALLLIIGYTVFKCRGGGNDVI